MKSLAMLALLILPHDLTARDQCDRIERNHFYDQCGQRVFTQIVTWDSPHVFFWRMDRGEMLISRERGGWLLRFSDGDIQREVWAKSFDETFTQTDVEVDDRAYLPVEQRRRLKGANK